jgi:hypothetical protein
MLHINGKVFIEPLPRNGPGTFAHVTLVALQWVYTPQYCDISIFIAIGNLCNEAS